jgi:hypothetical protein
MNRKELEKLADKHGISTSRKDGSLCPSLKQLEEFAQDYAQSSFALEVFRIAGGDTECCPNPTADEALACLRDLRECYGEALKAMPSAE